MSGSDLGYQTAVAFLNGLDERRARAVAAAERLSSAARALLATAAELRSRATELRIAASETRFRQTCGGATPLARVDEGEAWFTVRGIVDGRTTRAQWAPGHLDCDHQLMQRAEVVVAMGERFSTPWSPAASLPASIEGPPVAVLLTVMRAFSRVTSVDLHTELLETVDPTR